MPHFIRSISAAALLFAGFAASSAHAQTVEDFAGCVGVSNDIERLACFDKIAAPLSGKPVAAAACKPMTVEDLKLDFNDLVGTCAEVSGFVMQAADMAMLMQSQMDANPFFVDTSKLSREERKVLLNCPTGCRLTVIGTVGELNYTKGIKATSIRQ
jgi:hypothetical protein